MENCKMLEELGYKMLTNDSYETHFYNKKTGEIIAVSWLTNEIKKVNGHTTKQAPLPIWIPELKGVYEFLKGDIEND